VNTLLPYERCKKKRFKTHRCRTTTLALESESMETMNIRRVENGNRSRKNNNVPPDSELRKPGTHENWVKKKIDRPSARPLFPVRTVFAQTAGVINPRAILRGYVRPPPLGSCVGPAESSARGKSSCAHRFPVQYAIDVRHVYVRQTKFIIIIILFRAVYGP